MAKKLAPKLRLPILGIGEDTPVGAAVAVDAIVAEDVVAGDVLAAGGEVVAGLRVAVRDLHLALVVDHAAPDLAFRAESGLPGIAQTGIGELRILHGVAGEREGEGSVAGLPHHAPREC